MEDQRIVELYWERSEEALSATSQKYGRYLKIIAQRILGSETDADECVNDALLGAWNAMPPNRPSSLAAFLARITRNIALNRYSYRTAQKRSESMEILLAEMEDCLPDRFAQIPYREGDLAAGINTFLEKLPPKKRIVLVRRYWYADSVAEIAKAYGMREGTVKSILFRTRNDLKIFLEKEGLLYDS